MQPGYQRPSVYHAYIVYIFVSGNVDFFKVNTIMETIRPVLLKQSQDDFGQLSMVVISQRYRVMQIFHERAAFDYPLKVESQYVANGKSSLVRQITVTEVNTGDLVIEFKQKVVCIDNSTRRPSPLPKDFLRLIGSPFQSGLATVFPPITVQQPPAGFYSSAVEVQASDMDYMLHTNQASYMRFALDCIAKAAREGTLSGIKDDVCYYRAREACTLHMKESFAGDLLTVKIWESRDNPLLIHCLIQKAGNDVYYNEVSFYPRENTAAKL